jgi:hypothetical protein
VESLLPTPLLIRPTRPTGVAILTVLQIISGIGDVLVGIILLFGGLVFGILGGGILGSALLLLGTLAFALGVFSFILAFGLWTGKGWAWSLSLIGAMIGLVLGVLGIVVGGLTVVSLAYLVPIILSVLILVYLNTNAVRVFFGRPVRMPMFRPVAPSTVAAPYPPMAQPPYSQPAFQQQYYPQPQQGTTAQPAPWMVCPNCATPYQAGANFCDRCGTRLR